MCNAGRDRKAHQATEGGAAVRCSKGGEKSLYSETEKREYLEDVVDAYLLRGILMVDGLEP